MSRLPNLAGEFRLAADPELRFTQAGKAVCELRIVTSERRKNPHTNEWEDGDRTPFISVSLWEREAEAAAETFRKGQRVLVTGQLYARQYERSDGGKGEAIELKWATVAPVPDTAPRGQGGAGQAPAQADPWAAPSSDAPPF